jgi:hypothetical protein
VAATLGVVFIVFIWEFARDAYFAVAGSDKMASCLKRLEPLPVWWTPS